MEMKLSERQATALASLSTRTGRSQSDLLLEAVDRFLAQESWLNEQIQVGIDQIARGEFLTEEEMDARVARMTRS